MYGKAGLYRLISKTSSGTYSQWTVCPHGLEDPDLSEEDLVMIEEDRTLNHTSGKFFIADLTWEKDDGTMSFVVRNMDITI